MEAKGNRRTNNKKEKTVKQAKLSFKMRKDKTFPDKQKLEEFVAKQTFPMINVKGSPGHCKQRMQTVLEST